MPTVFRHGPFRFFFYSSDKHEPPHVHISRDTRTAKIWLEPVSIERSSEFSRSELLEIIRLVKENKAVMLKRWYEYFGN